MPRDFITADTGFPNLTGNETVEEKVDRLYDYTFMLLESLRYVLRNLDADNFNAAAVDEFRKAYKDNAVEALAAFKTEANDTYAKAQMLTEFKEEMKTSFSKFETEATANYATTSMLSDFKIEQETAFNTFKGEQQNAYDYFTKTQTDALASVETTADVNGAFIRMLAQTSKITFNNDGELVDENGKTVNMAEIVLSAANSGKSEISLNADRISFGNDAGVYGDGNLYLLKLFGKSNITIENLPGWFYLELDSDLNTSDGIMGGDLVIKSVAEADSWTGKDTTLYGFRYGVSPGNQTTSVNFVVSTDQSGGEKSIIGYNYSEEKTYPKGVWDFSSCDITGMTGLAVYFS